MGHRYIGSKLRILDTVISKMQSLVTSGDTITDLMCGTATVSIELRRKNFRVIANDLMTYSYHHAVTGLKLSEEPSFIGAQEFISEILRDNKSCQFDDSGYGRMLSALSDVDAIKGYFWNEFSSDGVPRNTERPRNYFSPNNAEKIDGIRQSISYLYKSRKITEEEYSLLQHDLIMAANDIANIAGTYGHYLANLGGRAKDDLSLKKSQLFLKNDKDDHTVLRGYAEDVSGDISCDLCYIDPPYMKRQYAANYHILETLARGDEPEAIGVSGLRPWRDQYSNFCTKTKIRDSFKKIFSDMNCPQFLISYSEDGLLTVEDFEKLLKPFGTLTIDEFSHKRFKSNKSQLKSSLTEYLIHIEK